MSARSKRVGFLVLVFVALLLLPGYAFRGKKHPDNSTIYDVRDYGAVADAVEATDCDAGEATPFPEGESLTCGTPGTGTDNEAAFERAINAAIAAGGGTVYIPCGLYRTAGWIDVAGDNVVIEGEGECSVVLPDDGVARIFNVCNTQGTGCATQIQNFTARNFVIRDDDPIAHGCQHCEVVTVTGITGAFDYAEPITFDGGGGETAYFYWQSADAGTGTIIFTEVSAATVAIGDTLTGTNSTAEALIATITHEAVEESHGLYMVNVNNPVVENMHFDFIGDESVVFQNPTTNGRATGNYFNNTPAAPGAKGSALDVAGAVGTIVSNNHFVLGVGSGRLGSNGGIAVTASTAAAQNTIISNNYLIEPNDDADDHTSAEFGVFVASNAAGDVVNTSILGNYIELDIDELGTCTVAGTVCEDDGDCGANYCDPTTYNPGCAGAILCKAIIANESGGNQVDGLDISNNPIVGTILARTNQADSALMINGNTVRGIHGDGIAAEGEYLTINANTISGAGLRGIHIHDGSGQVIISNNNLDNIGDEQWDALVNPAVIGLYDDTTAETYIISGNNIIGQAGLPGIQFAIDCNRDPNGVVMGNIIDTSDATAIRECDRVIGNYVDGGTGIGLFSVDGGVVAYNYVKTSGAGALYCSACTNTVIMGNTLDTNADPGIEMAGGGGDFNICLGNINMDAGETIECGNATVAGEGCTTEGDGGGANTICENNIER